MNQEQIVYDKKLTPIRTISYAKGGGNTMADGSISTPEQDQPKAEERKTTDVKKEKKDKLQAGSGNNGEKRQQEDQEQLQEKREKAEKAWKEHYEAKGEDIDKLRYYEAQIVRWAIEKGYAPKPHESILRIDTANLPPDLPPEVRRLLSSTNEMLDLIPPDAAEQQLAALEQVQRSLETADLADDVRAAIEVAIRTAIIDTYAIEVGETEDVEQADVANMREKPLEEVVIKNSKIVDNNERLAKAEKEIQGAIREKDVKDEAGTTKEGKNAGDSLFQGEFSLTQRAAIIEAHEVGEGELGKDGKDAHVYNYTLGQLRRKTEILRSVGFDPEQTRFLIEHGYAAEPVENPASITDPRLVPIVEEINREQARVGPDKEYAVNFLADQIHRIQRLLDEGRVNEAQGLQLLDSLNRWMTTASAGGERVGWYLTEADRRELVKGREGIVWWLNEQLKTVYTTADQGQEAQSTQMQQLQQVFQEANRFVGSYYRGLEGKQGVDPGLADFLAWELSDAFNVRLNMLYGRTAVDSGNIEQMVAVAGRAKAEGIGKALALDEGRVLVFFTRAGDLLEQMRLSEGGLEKHITPEMIKQLAERLKNEQIELAKKGVGAYVKEYKAAEARTKKYRESVRERLRQDPDAKGADGKQLVLYNDAQFENKVAELTKQDMLRSERTAMDAFVFLQQLGLLNARGDFPRDENLRRTSPGGGLPFNMQVFQAGQGQKLTVEGEVILDEVMIDMADRELRERGLKDKDIKKIHPLVRKGLGEKLLQKIYAPADFFSSGWRMATLRRQQQQFFEYKAALATLFPPGVVPDHTKVTPAQIEAAKRNLPADVRAAAKEQAEQFALFTRLTKAGEIAGLFNKDNGYKKNKNVEYREKEDQLAIEWGKITKYRPEEIMRLFRDRASEEEAFVHIFNSEPFLSTFAIPADLKYVGIHIEDSHHHHLSHEEEEKRKHSQQAAYRYDQFKKKYGSIIAQLRASAFNEPIPRQLDITQLSPDEQKQINDFLGPGEADRVKAMYQAMQNGIRHPHEGIKRYLENKPAYGSMTEALIKDLRFVDIYEHTLIVDDTLLGQLEKVPDASGMVVISKVWSNEIRGDALVRNFVDIQDGSKAQQALMAFFDKTDFEERVKSLKEAGAFVHSMNGADTRVDLYRHVAGTLLNLAKKHKFLDVFNVEKLPFHIPSSKLEKLIGPHAKPLGGDELLHMINNLRNEFTNHADEENMEEKLFLSPEERAEKIEHRRQKAERIVYDMKELLSVRPEDVVLRKSLSWIIYLLFGLFIESFDSLKKETGIKS